MEKKNYIRPVITVFNITPNVILTGMSTIPKATDEDYNDLEGEYFSE